MIQLPNNEKCYNLPEQVAQNLLNIKYLAEQYANIDALPGIWQTYKAVFDEDLDTFGDWTTTFEGWETTLATYLANMSSAAVGAIAGQTIAPAVVNATTSVNAPTVTGNSIVENMTGYEFLKNTRSGSVTYEDVYSGVVKNGNKITFVVAVNVTKTSAINEFALGRFAVPAAVYNKLFPTTIAGYSLLSIKTETFFQKTTTSDPKSATYYLNKAYDCVEFNILTNAFELNTTYYVRIEATFLLSDNMAA